MAANLPALAGKLWDAATGNLLITLRRHTDIVSAVDWSPKGGQIASASEDETIRIWELDDGEASRGPG